jgi:hypothetical protein
VRKLCPREFRPRDFADCQRSVTLNNLRPSKPHHVLSAPLIAASLLAAQHLASFSRMKRGISPRRTVEAKSLHSVLANGPTKAHRESSTVPARFQTSAPRPKLAVNKCKTRKSEKAGTSSNMFSIVDCSVLLRVMRAMSCATKGARQLCQLASLMSSVAAVGGQTMCPESKCERRVRTSPKFCRHVLPPEKGTSRQTDATQGWRHLLRPVRPPRVCETGHPHDTNRVPTSARSAADWQRWQLFTQSYTICPTASEACARVDASYLGPL